MRERARVEHGRGRDAVGREVASVDGERSCLEVGAERDEVAYRGLRIGLGSGLADERRTRMDRDRIGHRDR